MHVCTELGSTCMSGRGNEMCGRAAGSDKGTGEADRETCDLPQAGDL